MAKYEKYKNKLGEEVPSVTTIIGRFKNADPLLYWANKIGREGKTLKEGQAPGQNAGTVAHGLVEWFANEEAAKALGGNVVFPYPTFQDINPETVRKGEDAYEAFKKWKGLTDMTFRHTEVRLVSERFNFGGRLDAIALMGGQLALCDWKTSNSVYVDHTLQMAAYGHLWHETYPDHPLVGGYYLGRFAKEEGDFAVHHFPKLDRELVAFLKMRELFDLMKTCEKRVK